MTPLAARLTVDLDALAHNYAVLCAEAEGAEVAAVVKADAYGLGALPAAKRLLAEGARTFFAARLEEGERLRAALGAGPVIYLLDGCPPGAADRLAAADIRPVLNSLAQIESFAAPAGPPRQAALHIDTGMNRLGLRLEEARALKEAGDRLSKIDIDLVVSHLACADEPDHALNPRQLSQFTEALALFPGVRASLANSGGSFLGPDYRFDLVRPGISLYGGGPLGRPDNRLRAVATLEAPILQVRSVPPGESIGYGATHVFERPARVAVVAAGYADGLLRSSAPRGFAWFDGARRPMLGRLSMDLIALDITGCEAAAPGDMVELLGPNAPLDDVAAAAGTAAYECLTRLGPRGERRYLGEV